MKEERSGERRRRLGDLRCDVQIVLKPIKSQKRPRMMN